MERRHVAALLQAHCRDSDVESLLVSMGISATAKIPTVISKALDVQNVELVPKNPALFARLLRGLIAKKPFGSFFFRVMSAGLFIQSLSADHTAIVYIFLTPEFFSTFTVPRTEAMDESFDAFEVHFLTVELWLSAFAGVKATSQMSITFSEDQLSDITTTVRVMTGTEQKTIVIPPGLPSDTLEFDASIFQFEFAILVDRRILNEAVVFLKNLSDVAEIKVDEQGITFATLGGDVGWQRTDQDTPWIVNANETFITRSNLAMLTSLYATLYDPTATTILSKQGPLHIAHTFANNQVLVDMYLAPRLSEEEWDKHQTLIDRYRALRARDDDDESM